MGSVGIKEGVMSEQHASTRATVGAHASDASLGSAASFAARHDDVDPVTILAHDLRNYLTPVYGHLGTLYARAQHEEREHDLRAAERGRQALDYALLLLTNVLEASRMEQNLFESATRPLNLSLLVRQSAEVFDTQMRPVVVRGPEQLIVRGDSERLRQIVHNLLANAVRHSPEGAPISVQLTAERRECGVWALLRIHNYGAPIPPQMMSHLFERYVVGPGSRGLGLGLYVARVLAEAHGGALNAQSERDSGTSFVLALPLLSTDREAASEGTPNDEIPSSTH
jgi:two-component system, OmpR family, sensor kinase